MKKCEGIYSLIGKVNHKSAIYGFELLKEENIHPRQMPLIIHLKKCEGCTQKELAEKMQVKPSTLNVMIGRMEKNGYIEKKQDEKDSRKSRGRGTVCIYQNLRRPETPRDVQFYKRGAGRTQETVK